VRCVQRYIAADISEKMLARARRRAERASLARIEVLRGDMTALPIADDQADLFLSFSGLHMIENPQSAVAEIGRALKPGGEVVGCTFLAGGSARQRFLFNIDARRGLPLPPDPTDLRRWLADAGIEDVVIEPEYGFGSFRGRKAAA
jgi:ubiquinone/menaquinone biosynthesis C-methylase UbiE